MPISLLNFFFPFKKSIQKSIYTRKNLKSNRISLIYIWINLINNNNLMTPNLNKGSNISKRPNNKN